MLRTIARPSLARRLALFSQSRGFKIYTRTGDRGESSLFNGERRRKDDLVFHALGDTDELNAALGVARAHCSELAARPTSLEVARYNPPISLMTYHEKGEFDLLSTLDLIQSQLLDIGSALATPRLSSSGERLQRTAFDSGNANELENWMDVMDAELPPLRNFILPSGGTASASLHLARAICRRAERSVVPLCLDGECDENVAVYINRLSDYLFVSARFVALRSGVGDVVYKKAAHGKPSSVDS